MTEEQKQALIDEIVIQALRDDVRQWKQRAEAAEAKLAELEKQKPVGYAVKRFDNGNFGSWLQSKGMAKGNADYYVVPLFERPAPSAGWEGLIPKRLPMDIPFAAHRIRNGGWNDCINAILRNIEEDK